MSRDVKVVPVPPGTSMPADVLRHWQQPREISLEEVVDAIIRLSRIDEGKLFALASEGKLWTVFPYTAALAETPEPEAWDDVEEAPARARSPTKSASAGCASRRPVPSSRRRQARGGAEKRHRAISVASPGRCHTHGVRPQILRPSSRR